MAGRGEQDAAVGVEPPGQGGHEVLVAALAGHQPVEAVEDAGRPGPSPARLRKAPLSTAASEARLQPLAAGVGQDEGQAALVQLDHVVEVAADLGQAAGRLVPDPDLEPGHPGRRWSAERLDLLQDLGLGPHPLGPEMARAPRPAKLSEASRAWADSWGRVSRRARWCRAGRRPGPAAAARAGCRGRGPPASAPPARSRSADRRVTVMKAAGKLALGSRSGIAGTSGSRAWATVTICSPWRR